ncbi:hypothetical protein, partial [Frankia sp. AiPa1]|uniref:DUF459 domain-containing protein n=1 Tax=Frankia sp. AiPa1 TaxID=573492 RepID=UPI00202B7D90
MFVGAVVLVVGTLVVQQAPTRVHISSQRQRVVLWGDSLAWEAGSAFTRDVEADRGNAALVRTWGGTAPCDWLADVPAQIHAFRPTVAALAFSGNQGSDCMRGRELIGAYRADVTRLVETLTGAGITVILVEAPPRADQAVDAAGRTQLDRLWKQIAAAHPRTSVAAAGRAVTDNGRFTPTLHCVAGETCGPSGFVTVRSPDGTHFCPTIVPPMTACPLPSPGAVRYGTAIAGEALAAGSGSDHPDASPGDGAAVQAELVPPGQVVPRPARFALSCGRRAGLGPAPVPRR